MLLASMPWPRAAEATAVVLALFSRAASAQSGASIPSPNLDFSQFGRVALAGDYDAISIYQYAGQSENPFTTNGSQALFSQTPNGLFTEHVNSDGNILAACPFVTSDGTLQGVVVGGNFTMLNSNPLEAVALWNPASPDQVAPLTGLSGQVHAVHCDKTNDRVYVGGRFQGANSQNAIVWMGNGGWTNMPFEGFNGPINAISQSPDNNNVIFAGQFMALGNVTDNSTMTNTTEQAHLVVNIGGAGSNVSAAESSTMPGFDDPMNIICKTSGQDGPGNTWLAQDNTRATWKVISEYGYEPTRLRLWNTRYQGRGTKSWRFTAFPINGIMNFTYTDPADGQNKTCDAECPLSNDPKIEYQDFYFVNVIGMTAFQIDMYSWYGQGAGLNGVQLTQQANYVYAISDFNAPQCSNTSYPANSTATGPWQVTPSGQSIANYLSANLSGPGVNSDSAVVTFFPTVEQSGTYQVNVYTPGCQPGGTCSSRGVANVTGVFTKDGKVVQMAVSQTNQFEKYDGLYTGHVDLPDDSFRPYVQLQPMQNQNDGIDLVALRVAFNLQQADGNGTMTTNTTITTTSDRLTTVLNGLFEVDPNNATVNTHFNESAVNRAGQNLSANAEITTMALANKALYIAGNFSTDQFQNIFAYSNGQSNALAQGGLNGRVASMIPWGNMLFIGGNFTNTRDGKTSNAQNVVAYDSSSGVWSSLGGGVNGPVTSIVPLELLIDGQNTSCITVNGPFTKVLPGPNNNGFNATDGLAIWIPTRNLWMQNLNTPIPAIRGQLTYAVNYTGSSGNGTLLAGTISSQGMAIQDVVSLSSNNGNADIESLGLQEPQVAASGSKIANKVATNNGTTTINLSGAVAGMFVTDNGRNISIVGGNFQTNASNGTTVNNLVFINSDNNGNNNITGVASGIDTNSTFLALARGGDNNDGIYAGGAVHGELNNQRINGMMVWNLTTGTFAAQQPVALEPANSQINTITYDSANKMVYAGGSFVSAGAITCPGLCMWSPTSGWTQPGRGFSGVANTLMWQGTTKLLIGGNFTSGNNQTSLALYDTNAQSWTTPNNTNQVPGPVSVLVPAEQANTTYWLAGVATNGSSYLMKYDGTNYRTVGPQFGAGTIIRGLTVVSLTQSHAGTDLLDGGYSVLVTGQLSVPNFGNASAVLFNGTAFQPFILSNSGNGAGSVSQLFSQNSQNFTKQGNQLALGFVVLIALAIALGLIFLIVVAGMLLERYRKRREGYRPAPQNYVEKTANMGRIPPDQLLGNLSRGNEGPRI